MFCFKRQSALFRLLLALFFAMAIYAPSASALEIPCASFEGKCKSLITRLGISRTEPGEYVIADKTEIAPGYEAVVLNRKSAGSFPDRWGVFIVDAGGKNVLTLETFPKGEASGLQVRLGKHSEDSLVVIGYEDYGFEQIKTKYLFDLASRKKLSAIKAGVDVDVRHIIEFNGAIYGIGKAISGNNDTRNANAGIADNTRAIIATISLPPVAQPAAQAAGHFPGQLPAPMAIEILDTIGKRKIETILDAKKDGNRLILTSKHHRYILANGTWKTSANPAPEKFSGLTEPVWRIADQGVKLPGYPYWVIGNRGFTHTKTKKSYPLPQPSYTLFRKLRPVRVGDGYDKETTSLENEIGPWRLVDGKVWFGLNFYDGEGSSGIGGIGSFDLSTRKFQISYLKEIAGDSSFAMLVEPDTIWLGLGVQPEGADSGTGIAKINRSDHSVVRYKAPGIVNAFVRSGDKVFAATTDGMMVFGDDGRIENVEFSINKDGSYSPVVKQAAEAAYEVVNQGHTE